VPPLSSWVQVQTSTGTQGWVSEEWVG
jgi:hypothetical protein